MKMFINICTLYIVLLKNIFISYNNNNNLQQIGYALELPPVNII